VKRLAVAILHGIEIEDRDFAATPTRLLHEGFARAMGPGGPDPREALAIQPVHWAPHLEGRQRELFERMSPGGSPGRFDAVARTVRRLNAGSVASLVPLVLGMVQRNGLSPGSLHYPTGRWLMLHFVGDVIAYDRQAGAANYEAVHRTFAEGLASLAAETGGDAPLCVVAHSFGTVLASDYFYDQQVSARGRRDLVPAAVRDAGGGSALARGDTLAWMYTMGSPMALWSLRYPRAELNRPIRFPARRLSDRYPGLATEWVNFVDQDDVIAYPLRPLSEAYAKVVSQDRPVSVKRFTGLPASLTPLVHPFYWADRSVTDPIARSLAAGWRQLNASARRAGTPRRGSGR
jgi:hypothetical protein